MPSKKSSKTKKAKSAGEKRKKWTVLVYMAASKDEETESAAIRDIKELQEVGTNDDINVAIQIDRRWPGYPERYVVGPNLSKPTKVPDRFVKTRNPSPEGDILSKDDVGTLRNFLEFGHTYASADHYMLVLWGHAYGLGFGRDHGNPLTLRELSEALAPYNGKKLDILGANACAISYAEAAFELQNTADLLVASEISIPFAGWPYASILRELTRTPTLKPEKFAKRIVDLFFQSFNQKNVAMSLLDLRQAKKLGTTVPALARALRAVTADGSVDRPVVEAIRGAFLDTAHGDVRPLIDLKDLCQNLRAIKIEKGRRGDDTITTSEKEALDGIQKTAGELSALITPRKTLVLEHTADDSFEGLNGLGIFAPAIGSAADQTKLELNEKEYRQLALVELAKGDWASLVYTDLKRLMEPLNTVVGDFVNSVGGTRGEDRSGVAQLVIGIDRAFANLETAIGVVAAASTRMVTSPANGAGERVMSDSTHRLGFPFLRLAQSFTARFPAQSTNGHGGNGDAIARVVEAMPGNRSVDNVADALMTLEDRVSAMEKAVKRVMTHSHLGLGEVDSGVKPGALGRNSDSGVKPGALGGDSDSGVKPGALGRESDSGVKPGALGIATLLAGANGSSTSSSSVITLANIYSDVASSLRRVEEALAGLESLLQVIAAPTSADHGGQSPDFRDEMEKQVKQAVRQLREMVSNARQVTVSAIVHPIYGLGPSLQFGGDARQQLAVAGGLSSGSLRLL
jgi:hypothetical protein